MYGIFLLLGSLLTGDGARAALQPPANGCHTDDPNHICLALKYTVYVDPATSTPIASQADALNVVQGINSVWKQCNISFEVERYVEVDPSQHKFPFQTANYPELTRIRDAFADDRTMLVVFTGAWNRDGTLGNTGANAWTSMPGGPPYGAVLERPVVRNANLLAHELGHYLNLSHETDSHDLMNPVIYNYSQKIYDNQCRTARAAAQYFWSAMIR